VVDYLLFQPALSVALSLTAFSLVIWPGYAVLHLLGLGHHRWVGAQFAGPAVTLALWIIVLSGAAWASIPLRVIFAQVWIATAILAAIGIVLWISVTWKIAFDRNPRRRTLWRRTLFLWALAAVLSLSVMPTTFNFGLGIFANSTSPDSWAYIAVADYLSTVARGTDGGLSSLHQFAAHLMTARNASSVLLAFLADGLGTRADQSMALFCIIVVFANASALIAFALTLFGDARAAAALLLLAGFATPAIVLHYGNFDQLLLLPLLPVTAALGFRAGNNINLRTTSFLIGILMAGAFLTYVELAVFGIAIAMSFLATPRTSLPLVLTRGAVIAAIAIPTFLLFASPGLIPLIAMLKGQFAAASGDLRPGDQGPSSELISRLGLLGALWSRTTDFLSPQLIAAMLACGVASIALVAIGAWSERRRWASLLGLGAIALAASHFWFNEHYIYAVYKIVSVNFWMIGFFAVAGALLIQSRVQVFLPRQFRSVPTAVVSVFAALFVCIVTKASMHQFSIIGEQQQSRREALTIARTVGQSPTLLSVRDDLANEWAVFYLTETPLLINPYRGYMAGSHVIPYMDRAKSVDPSSVRYIVTDHNEEAPVKGAVQIWDGSVYRLWETDGKAVSPRSSEN
jgi:hypothetical protein